MFLIHWYRWLYLIPFYSSAWLLLGSIENPFPNYRRLGLTLSLGTSFLIVFSILFGKWTHQLSFALILGSVLATLGSGALLLRKKSLFDRAGWRLDWSAAFIFFSLFTIATTVAATIVAVKFTFHDQLKMQGHLPLIESILRGNLPPSMTVFPDIPLKYHYGADIFGAVMAYVASLPAYQAIDITQSFGWLLMVITIFIFCREAGLNRTFSVLATVWLPLAGGWMYLLPFFGSHISNTEHLIWAHSYIVFGRNLNPGTVSNFYMTPYSLGLPLFFAYLAIFARWTRQRNLLLLGLGAWIIGSLAVIQVTFFFSLLSVTVALLLAQKFFENVSWSETGIAEVELVGISILLALLLGGFFTRSEAYSSHLLVFNWPPGYLKNATWGSNLPITTYQAFLWYMGTFGSLVFLAVPFFCCGLLLLRKKWNPILFFLLLYAAECFLITQFIRYRLTWDIIKWFTGFHVTAILYIVFIFAKLPKKAFLAFALIPLLILDLVAPVRFLYQLAFSSAEAVPADHRDWFKISELKPPSPDLQRILDLLRQYSWKEVVFSPYNQAQDIADYSGQSVSEIDINTIFFGVKPEILRARKALTSSLANNFQWENILTSPIRWLAFPCQDYDKAFSVSSKQTIDSLVQSRKLANLSFSMGTACWKIYHVDPSFP